MFEYAAGRALAMRSGAALRLDPTRIHFPGPRETRRAVAITAFRAAGTVQAPERRRWARAARYSPLAARAWDRLPGRLLYDRRPHALDQRLVDRMTPATLDGYWQREEYFADAADIIRSDFTPAEAPGAAWQSMARLIADDRSIGVHIRRGDYVTNPSARAHHGLVDSDYVRRALDIIGPSETTRSFVFSDDPAWCRDNLSFLPSPTFVEGFADHEELLLLSLCTSKAIANSSFSWWAAWLGDPEGVVVAPKAWQASAGPDAPSPVPGRWHTC